MEKNNRKEFIKWIREVINPQATPNGNSVALNDYSKDGMIEYSYPKKFIVNGSTYYWTVSSNCTKGRHLTTHYELWFYGAAFKGAKKLQLEKLHLVKLEKG